MVLFDGAQDIRPMIIMIVVNSISMYNLQYYRITFNKPNYKLLCILSKFVTKNRATYAVVSKYIVARETHEWHV